MFIYRCVPIREASHNSGSAANFTVQTLKRIVRPDVPPVGHGKIIIRKRFVTAELSNFICFIKALRLQFAYHFQRFPACGFFILLGMNSFKQQSNFFGFTTWNRMQHVAIKMHHATLSFGVRVKFSKCLQKTRFLSDTTRSICSSPRPRRYRRNCRQLSASSREPSAAPTISRKPLVLTPMATSTDTF